MRNNLIFIFILCPVFCFGSAFGQTVSDIETKYGKPVKSYAVTEQIWMTPQFSADGQVCRMSLYPRRVAAGSNIYLYKELAYDDFRKAVDLLVPNAKRGAMKEPFERSTYGTGAFWTIFDYENVRIQYSVGVDVDFVPFMPPPVGRDVRPVVTSPETLSTPSTNKESKETRGAQRMPEGFKPHRAPKYEVVTISWNKKKCAGK
jgi:hypothetical protein